MRRFISFFLLCFITLAVIRPQEARAQIPVKGRAFLMMAGYGAASGALLGLASMAFGQSSRAVAQGASLGLYAGIIFGTYVLVSHHQARVGNYEDSSSPYQRTNDIYGEEYNSEDGGDGQRGNEGGFFDRFRLLQEQVHNQSFTFDSVKKKGGQLPPIQFNILNLEF